MSQRWPAYDAVMVPLHHTKAVEDDIAVGNRCQCCTTLFRNKGDGSPRTCLNCEPGAGRYPLKRKGKNSK